jgi:hypothetical protein
VGILGLKTSEDLGFNVALRGKLENQEFKEGLLAKRGEDIIHKA